jgi:hypothetical protein
VCAPDLQVPDAPTERAETPVELVLPVGSQIAPGAEREMNTFVEVLTCEKSTSDTVTLFQLSVK